MLLKFEIKKKLGKYNSQEMAYTKINYYIINRMIVQSKNKL